MRKWGGRERPGARERAEGGAGGARDVGLGSTDSPGAPPYGKSHSCCCGCCSTSGLVHCREATPSSASAATPTPPAARQGPLLILSFHVKFQVRARGDRTVRFETASVRAPEAGAGAWATAGPHRAPDRGMNWLQHAALDAPHPEASRRAFGVARRARPGPGARPCFLRVCVRAGPGRLIVPCGVLPHSLAPGDASPRVCPAGQAPVPPLARRKGAREPRKQEQTAGQESQKEEKKERDRRYREARRRRYRHRLLPASRCRAQK